MKASFGWRAYHADCIASRVADVKEVELHLCQLDVRRQRLGMFTPFLFPPNGLTSSFFHNCQLLKTHSIPDIMPNTPVVMAKMYAGAREVAYHNG